MQRTERSEDITSSRKTVHTSEKAYFDTRARQDLEGLETGDWLVDPAAHRATLKLWGFDGDLSGKKVLECGCGTGFFAVLLAKTGAEVFCFDLSSSQLYHNKPNMEKTLYDTQGEPVAYISDHLNMVIYLWDGHPAAYLYDYHVYGFNGQHLGWFLDDIA